MSEDAFAPDESVCETSLPSGPPSLPFAHALQLSPVAPTRAPPPTPSIGIAIPERGRAPDASSASMLSLDLTPQVFESADEGVSACMARKLSTSEARNEGEGMHMHEPHGPAAVLPRRVAVLRSEAHGLDEITTSELDRYIAKQKQRKRRRILMDVEE